MKLTAKNISKSTIFFVLDDVLVPGAVNPHLSAQKVKDALLFLKGLQDRNLVELFLLCGQQREKAVEKISKSALSGFFRPDKIFFFY